MTKFGKLNPDGTLSDERDIPQEKIKECPFYILVPEHYRDDNSCRCDDPTHREMDLWGYSWEPKLQRWTAPQEPV